MTEIPIKSIDLLQNISKTLQLEYDLTFYNSSYSNEDKADKLNCIISEIEDINYTIYVQRIKTIINTISKPKPKNIVYENLNNNDKNYIPLVLGEENYKEKKNEQLDSDIECDNYIDNDLYDSCNIF